MAKQKPEGALLAYLEEHLAYERKMLGFTYEMMFQTEGLRWCAYFESFGIHARNLYHFLRHDGNAATTIRADDYVPGRKRPDHLNIESKMNASFFHLSTSRLDDKPVCLADAIEIGGWIDKEWAVWTNELPDHFKALVEASAKCPQPREAAIGPLATNQPTTTSSAVVIRGHDPNRNAAT